MPMLAACRPLATIAIAALLFLTPAQSAGAQSQEPRPTRPATPVAPPDGAPGELPETGVRGTSWVGPSWGLAIAWDADVWTVENEQIVPGYDGLQLGTPASTVFIEAYEGFSGNADDCLADAVREINERDSITEVAELDGRPLPEVSAERGPSALLGILATLPDGQTIRGVEYVECRTAAPGTAVLEVTWQTTTAQFNDELPLVGALFSTLTPPNDGDQDLPALPAEPPPAVPNTALTAGRLAA